MEKKTAGYDDTPMIPGTNWRVHDASRPAPPTVKPPTGSTETATPPSDAVVLFDGTDLSQWQTRDGGPAGWKVENGYMEVVPQSGNIVTKNSFGDCQLHVEWASPEVLEKDSQGRGNSGVFLMGRYEIQVLDNYENSTYADGYAGAIYGEFPPLVNACRKPGEWQSYDIIWLGPRFEGERLIRPAYLTVLHNGLVVQYHQMLIGPTSHKKVAAWEPHPPEGPLMLQDHRNPVRFRNIWYRPISHD